MQRHLSNEFGFNLIVFYLTPYLNTTLTNILVHVERLHVLERDLAQLMVLNQFAVHAQRCAAGRQAQHEEPDWCTTQTKTQTRE